MLLSAIDIGSNAVRLLVAEVHSLVPDAEPHVRKIKLFRLPVRLGLDAFTLGSVSDERVAQLVKAMKSFSLIMQVYDVQAYRACATSALREAANGEQVIQAVYERSGIQIELIDGDREAELILSNRLAQVLDERFGHLYVDVGGGSTEISLLNSDETGNLSRSFKIGTIRLFNGQVSPESWEEMGLWLESCIKPQKPLAIIGSGGNINHIYKRTYNPRSTPLIYDRIRQERDLLSALSIEDRMELQDMYLDRAQVIVPALDIFLFIMENTGIKQVMVPKIGLSDGIVRQLYRELALENA